MNKYLPPFISFLILISFVLLPSCQNEGCTDPTAFTYSLDVSSDSSQCEYPEVKLVFRNTINGQQLVLGNTYLLDTVLVNFGVCQFYISSPEVSYLDLGTPPGDGSSDTYFYQEGSEGLDLGTLYAGHNNNVIFNVGIAPANNHPSLDSMLTLPSGDPLGVQDPEMFWNPERGYIFVRLEGRVDTDGDGTLDDSLIYQIGTDTLLMVATVSSEQKILSANHEIGIDFELNLALEGIDLKNETRTYSADTLGVAEKIATNLRSAFVKRKY